MTYRIETGIDIPEAYNRPSEFMTIIPFLRVGESFLVKDKSKFRKAKAITHNYKTRQGKGKDFCTRQMSDGLRIWRIK